MPAAITERLINNLITVYGSTDVDEKTNPRTLRNQRRKHSDMSVWALQKLSNLKSMVDHHIL